MSEAERLKAAFKAFDANQDGNIELVELREVLQMLSPSTWTPSNIKAFLDQLDTDGNGTIQYSEFIDYICGGSAADKEQLISDGVVRVRSEHHEFLNAARNYNWAEVRRQLEAEPLLVNVRPCGRWSALHQAAASGNAAMVSYLLDHQADVNVMNRAHQTPLQVADGEAIGLLSGASGIEVDDEALQLKVEHALLDDAKYQRWSEVCRKCTESPKLVNVQPCSRYSCLHQAVYAKNKEMVSFLLEKKADVTLVTRDGKTALELAEAQGQGEIVELLEEAVPREACVHGDKCGDFTDDHRRSYSHPGSLDSKRVKESAAEYYGDGQWEMNIEHIRDEDGWVPLPTSFEGDWALYNFMHQGGAKDAVLHVSELHDVLPNNWRMDPFVQHCTVDMKDMYVSISIQKKRRGSSTTSMEHFGLRRTGSTVYPGSDVTKHPFEEKLQRDRDIEDGFLTNEIFFRTFCQAVEMGKERLSTNEQQHYEKWLSDNLDEDEMFDYQYNADLMGMSPAEASLERRGGVLYRTPAGWKRIALHVWDKYDDGDNTWLGMSGTEGEWAVAYHGCAMAVVPLIMKGGFRVGTGQGAKNCTDTRTEERVGDGVYCSPNITVVECYANGNEDGASENKTDAVVVEGRTLFFAFQCRVRPQAIRRPDRHFAHCNDEEVMGIDGVFEWIINNPDDIRPYAILVREKAGSDHRSLGQLICSQAWNKSHKPLPFGSFDKIPGRTADVKQIQTSYLRAQKALL